MIRRVFRCSFQIVAYSTLIAGHVAAQDDYMEDSSACSTYSSIAGAPGAITLNTVSNCDDCTELVSLPFIFNWFGDTPITQVRVSSNGQINVNSSDSNSNCCSADAVEVGGSYTQPRIAIAQEDLFPVVGPGAIWALDTGSSYIIDFANIGFFAFRGDVNAQTELFPNGTVEIRWGVMSGDNIAAGVEDDTRAPASATPASGAPFGAGGIAPSSSLPSLNGQCRRFTVNTPPMADCVESVNPSGENTPPAGSTTLPGSSGGQNEDGFYELVGEDTEDGPAPVFVTNASGSATFGPFSSGSVVKITEAPGRTPTARPMGGPNSAVAAHIILDSDAFVFAVDSFGEESPVVSCLVPPPPK
jgi:hypothetical protein